MYSAGIDIGGTFAKLALVSSDEGTILRDRRLPTVPGSAPAKVVEKLGAVLEEMACSASLPYPPPGGVGIGIPGVVDHQSGRLIFSGPLEWRDVPLGQLAGPILGCEVQVDTDVNAGALADLYYGCARGSADVLYISWGTGIGAGLVIARKLYHTRAGAMCNLGHMLADAASDRLCYCGCKGCLEIEAGGRAMVDQVRERIAAGEASLLQHQEITPERIAWAAGQQDQLARRVLERAVVLMARVLGSVMALLNPDTIVFGGGVSRCLPLVRAVFDDELWRRTPAFSLNTTALLESEFGESAGVLGAALLPMARMEL